MNNRRKCVFALFVIIFGIFNTSFSSIAAEEYLLTLICKPQCSYTEYDEIIVRMVNTDNMNSYTQKLYAYNNFSEKAYLPQGHYVMSDVSMVGREDAIFQTGYKEFDLDSNMVVVVDLIDSGVVATSAIITTTVSETTVPPTTDSTLYTTDENITIQSPKTTTNSNYVDPDVTSFSVIEEFTTAFPDTSYTTNHSIVFDEKSTVEVTTSQFSRKKEKIKKTVTKIGVIITCVAGLALVLFVGFIIHSRKDQ